MSNQYNYKSDIFSLSQEFKRFRVSRIIDNPVNRLLEVEIPTSVPDEFTVELMLYTLDNNELVSSLVLDNTSNIFRTVSLNYSPATVGGAVTQRKILFINFAETTIPLTQGRYEMVLNFFVPEIGTFNEGAFAVTTISPSRRELELKLTPQCGGIDYINKLKEFASPQINRESILNALKQIFNQQNSRTLGLQTDNTTLTYDIIQDYFSDSTQQQVSSSKVLNSDYENLLTQSIQVLQDRAYMYASESIQASTTKVFTDTMIYDIVSSSLGRANDEVTSEVILL